ncbi:MAG: hypothetical protein QF441_16995 [Bacteriovoracaceae bacterium]|jgi:hypothetical protein|nr:hypothetical protein [Bacteriovoracaceae bacterium]
MGILETKTKCCGSDFRRDDIPFIGLLTLAFPLVVLTFFLRPISFFMRFLQKKKKTILDVLYESNLNLIVQAMILPQLKCSLASLLYSISPKLSGGVFKLFNFFIIIIIYGLFFVVLYGVFWWI